VEHSSELGQLLVTLDAPELGLGGEHPGRRPVQRRLPELHFSTLVALLRYLIVGPLTAEAWVSGLLGPSLVIGRHLVELAAHRRDVADVSLVLR
jgi:hypothetical protein